MYLISITIGNMERTHITDKEDCVMSKIRVLHILHGMETFGGVESFLLQYYKKMDRSCITFDFLMCCNNTFKNYENDSIFKDSKITALHALKTGGNTLGNYKKLVQEVNKYLEQNYYDVIHVNTTNVIVQMVLARYMRGDGVRIAHSHSATPKQAKETIKSLVKRSVKESVTPIFQRIIREKNDYLLACSKNAGESLFGKKGISDPKFRVVKNAIETENYGFDIEVRKYKRLCANIPEECKVYGTVGRLAESKNLLFLIDVFKLIHDKDNNSKLWIVGEGPMRNVIEEKIKECKVEDSVVLFGEQKQVAPFLMAMDYFIFPTVYEGLGIVAIEAQTAGLPVIVSDAVPEEARVIKQFYSITLDKKPSEWAEQIDLIEANEDRENSITEVADCGYDIKDAAEDLLSFYRKVVK